MPNNQDKSNLGELDSATTRELHLLCTSLFDEVISEEELARLNCLLTESRTARRVYLSYITLHSRLLACTGKDQQAEAEILRRHLTNLLNDGDEESQGELVSPKCSTDTQSDLFQPSKTPPHRGTPLIWATAASLLLCTLIWIVSPTDSTNKPSEFTKVVEKTEQVAHLSYVSRSTRWRNPDETYSQQAAVRVGSKLCLAEGEVELTYDTGTKLLLVGPAEFLVDFAGGKLRRGGLVASVTEAGQGFTIETPNGKVVDLGTEFGVAVDDFGLSEVSVFQGKVEAYPQGRQNPGKKYELTKGHGLQWNQHDLIPLDADLRRFATSLIDLSEDPGSNVLLVDQFREQSLDLQKWQVLGAMQTSPAGLKLIGGNDPNNRPYLISSEQFDPAQGAISVTCDFYFSDPESAKLATLSILTRSDDQRGVALAPWNGALASCMRCSYDAALGSREGVLQAGVKMESDRELTSIAGSSFLSPSPQTAYRMIMTDDGVNVSFTVFERDHPTSKKTITTRSLFRGKSNFVAVEGSHSGTIVIDRIEILQDLSTTPLSSYADFSSLLLKSKNQHDLVEQLLDEWVPNNATQIVHDDFDVENFNESIWMSLGDVQLLDGAVQLGAPNAEGHIDTWKARPYLLTRQPLDPNAGELTVLGSISFAENFLKGYGASFSVMTRADGEHGQGPGWENSVLRRGVRANFWPAAWDSEHSLEIHEKPVSNTITLLATQGMQVDPRTRSYLFRVVDNGQSVELTILNPLRTEETMTISSPTSLALNQGFVGFESCWGSPVTLDNLRIYQGKHPERTPTTSSQNE